MRSVLPALVVLVALGGIVAAVERIDTPPRRLAPWVERRAAGHRTIIQRTGHEIARALVALDRGRETFHDPMPVPAPDAAMASQPRRQVIVGSTTEALHAIDDAQPGDVITFIPGTYRFGGVYIDAHEPGVAEAPITVRAEKPRSVVLEFNMVEGFLVSAPYWTFENLTIRGVCADHSNCEHAFHVVGGASHFVARGNEVVDFNAQFKINGSGGQFPDWGVIEGNVIRNTAARTTANSVTSIDLVAASHWRIVGNRISDFVKARSDHTSYGAFAKGAGTDNRLLRNVVVCEDRLRGYAGQRVGLSLGGGGSTRDACRDHRCITEQDQGVIASNLVASCSDDGIYLNRAAMSIVSHNTLIDTGGITARFGESSGDADGNLVDGAISARAGATLHTDDNRTTSIPTLYLGLHPVRRLFADTSKLDLHWRSDPPRRQRVETVPADLCGATRPPRPSYGAFEDIARCAVSAD
jgi:parallel beta-helix repeat protein